MLARRVSELRDLIWWPLPSDDCRRGHLPAGVGAKATTQAVQLVAGLKWNVARTMVVGGHVRWSANRAA